MQRHATFRVRSMRVTTLFRTIFFSSLLFTSVDVAASANINTDAANVDADAVAGIVTEEQISDRIRHSIKTPCYHLHAIDLRRTDAESIQKELMDQMSHVGFLLLSHVPGYDEEEYLNATKVFHSLPESLKKTMYLQKDNSANPNIYRGYQPFKANDPSHKEFYDMGFPVKDMSKEEREYPLYERTPTLPDEYLWIHQVFGKVFYAWYKVALGVVRHLAVGLGKPADFFDPWFEGGSLSTFRSIHYLPRGRAGVDSSNLNEAQAMLTTPEHADSGLLTFLATFNYPGLQVMIDGEYRSIDPVPNTLVVNLGDTLARMSNYRLKATFHRVVDIGRERYSSPLFLEPKYSARIPLGLLSSERKSVAEDIKDTDTMFGDWLVRRIMNSYIEWRNFEVPAARKEAVAAVQLTDFVN